MKKSSLIALVGAAALLATGAAHAAHVNWSIGINLPPVATVISSGPAYPAYPAYPVYAPAPVVAPVVVYPEPYAVAYPGAYDGRPVYGYRHYRPAPVVYGPPGHWRHERAWAPVPRDERRFHH